MAKKVYINIDQLKSDGAALLCYVASDRSDGKTTHCISLAYDEYRASGKIGVMARRTCGEVTNLLAQTLFTNLRKVRKTGKLTARGTPKRDGIHLFEDGKEFAVLIAMSRAGKVKSSFDVATHKNLYFDEYVPLDGRYLKDEAEAILEVYRTIDRDSYTSRIWIFANHITATNPVFRYFDIIPRDGLSRHKNGRFLLLQCANAGNRDAVAASPLAELTAGTAYLRYALGGTLDKAGNMIQPTHWREHLPFLLRGQNGLYALFYARDGLVLDRAANEPLTAVYTVKTTNGRDGGIYIGSDTARPVRDALRARFFQSCVFMASETVFEDTKDIVKAIVGKSDA